MEVQVLLNEIWNAHEVTLLCRGVELVKGPPHLQKKKTPIIIVQELKKKKVKRTQKPYENNTIAFYFLAFWVFP